MKKMDVGAEVTQSSSPNRMMVKKIFGRMESLGIGEAKAGENVGNKRIRHSWEETFKSKCFHLEHSAGSERGS